MEADCPLVWWGEREPGNRTLCSLIYDGDDWLSFLIRIFVCEYQLSENGNI